MQSTSNIDSDTGHTMAQIVARTGLTRTTLYRHLPPRPEDVLTAATAETTTGT